MLTTASLLNRSAASGAWLRGAGDRVSAGLIFAGLAVSRILIILTGLSVELGTGQPFMPRAAMSEAALSPAAGACHDGLMVSLIVDLAAFAARIGAEAKVCFLAYHLVSEQEVVPSS